MDQPKPLGREHEHGVALGIILSLVTCALYNVYWNYRQFKSMNVLLGREEYDFFKWALLTMVTCGIYHVYTEYRMGSDLQGYMKDKGYNVSPNLALGTLALSCVGLTVVADAIIQHELNRLCA